jgi:hypothetical protein
MTIWVIVISKWAIKSVCLPKSISKNKRRKSKWPGSDYKLLSPSEYYNKTI